LLTTANIVLAIAVLAVWGISFVGINKYLKNHSTQTDNGFNPSSQLVRVWSWP
jgi:hypothetical protein